MTHIRSQAINFLRSHISLFIHTFISLPRTLLKYEWVVYLSVSRSLSLALARTLYIGMYLCASLSLPLSIYILLNNEIIRTVSSVINVFLFIPFVTTISINI